MWHADEAALIADRRDRFFRPQSGRDRGVEEQPDQVALRGADFLADQDDQARRRGRPRLEGSLDRVVIGDGEMGQAPAGRRCDDIGGPGERVEARPGVAVEIDERPAQRGCLTPTGRATS
jgi:hypothetical protein